MKRILLVCSAGMSTSILVNKMLKAAEEQGIEVKIEAHANNALSQHAGNWDVCMVGPQIRFAIDSVQKALDIPTEVIDMRVYGLADGAAALKRALEMIEESK